MSHESEARRARRQSNVEFVTELMEFSASGALTQIFIVDAIMKHAEAVATLDPKQVDHPMISGEAWVRCAQEIRDRVNAKYGTDHRPANHKVADL